MVESHVDSMMEEYNGRLSQQGISMEAYLGYMNMTMEAMREQLRPGAERQIKVQLALDAVVKAESIEITDETVDAEFQKMSDSMHVPLDQLKAIVSAKTIKQQMARDKALEVVTESAKPNLVSAEEAAAAVEVEEVKADEEKPAKKTRAKKAPAKTEDGEEAPKKTTRKKKADAEETEKTEE